MKKLILLSVIVICFAMQSRAQDGVLEKLQEMERQVASGELDEPEMLEQYHTLMWQYRTRDHEKTNRYFREAVAFARGRNNIEWESRYIKRMGVIYDEWGERDSAFVYLDRALAMIEGKGYIKEESSNYELRGVIYTEHNEHEKALESLFRALELNEKDKAQKIADKLDVAPNVRAEFSILENIGSVYYSLYNNEKALEYQLRARDVIEANRDVDLSRFDYRSLGNTAACYFALDRYDEAYPLFVQAYEMASARGELTSMVYSLLRLSDFHRIARQDAEQALAYAEEAMEVAEKTGMPEMLNLAEGALMDTYINMEEYETALRHAENVLARTESDDWEGQEYVYGGLIIIHAALGNVTETEDFLIKYRDLFYKYSDANLHQALQEMEVKYDVQQKELEIARQQAEITKHRTRQYLLAGGLLVAALLVALLIYIVMLRTRRNRILAEANATKDRFFSIISHDLKNPAIAQRDALQMLTDNSDKWDSDSLSRYYGELLKSADSQVELLYNLLNWAQVQTGRMPYNPVAFDLVPALRSDIALVKNMADRKGITFNVLLPDAAVVTGDANMLATVARNLLTNAVKFTGSGGEVSLEITPEADGKYTVAVSDTGTGMSRQQLENLFSVDRQRSRQGTAGEQGSGLGLVVCRELTEKHGSTLHVESEEGKGSRFWFVI